MLADPRYIQGILNENTRMGNQINRLSESNKVFEQKYKKLLKQLANIIQANQNLKKQMDELKGTFKADLDNKVREAKMEMQKRFQEITLARNSLAANKQALIKQKEQMARQIEQSQKFRWENQSLKNEISILKKQNEKLLLQTHPLTKNKDNPEHAKGQSKIQRKVEELNLKIAQLSVKNTQNKKYTESLEDQLRLKSSELSQYIQKLNQLNAAILKAQNKGKEETRQAKEQKYQKQMMDLAKQNSELINEINQLKLSKLQSSLQANRNQIQQHLISTLKSVCCQLEPLRYQIEQLKREKYSENQNSQKEKAELNIKLLTCQNQLVNLKQYKSDLEKRNKELFLQIKEKQWEKYKFEELEEEKRILQGRVIVYEAMQMVTRNRDKPPHIQRIQQFQRRIQLLLEEQNIKHLVSNASVHQLVAMKAYVIQMDNKLQKVSQQANIFHKKYSHYKEKYNSVSAQNKSFISKYQAMVNSYQNKINGYQKLVSKLTEQLQRLINENEEFGQSEQKSHFKSVLILYESKISELQNEVSSLKIQHKELKRECEIAGSQMKAKQIIIKQLNLEILKMGLQNRELKSASMRDSESGKVSEGGFMRGQDHLLDKKTKQILQLESELSSFRSNMDKMQFEYERAADKYKDRIKLLEVQLQFTKNELCREDCCLQKFKGLNAVDDESKQKQSESLAIENRQMKSLITQTLKQKQTLAELLKAKQSQMNICQNANKVKINQLISQIEKAKSETRNKNQEYQLLMQQKQSKLYIEKELVQQGQKRRSQLQQQNQDLKRLLEASNKNYMLKCEGCENWQNNLKKAQDYIQKLTIDFETLLRKFNDNESLLIQKSIEVEQWKSNFYASENQTQRKINVNQKPKQQDLLAQSKNGDKQNYEQINEKIRILEMQLVQNLNILNNKDTQVIQLVREIEQLQRALDQSRLQIEDKIKLLQFNERQVLNLRQQNLKLESEVSKMWEGFQPGKGPSLLYQKPFLVKEKDEKQSVSSLYQMQILSLNNTIKLLKQRESEAQKQFEKKINELNRQNYVSILNLQQEIKDLKKMMVQHELKQGQLKLEEAIEPLELHIKKLDQQIQAKQQYIYQVQEDLRYYKELASQKNSTQMSYYSTNPNSKYNIQVIELQNQVINLQNLLRQKEEHSECNEKQAMMKLQIHRLSNLLRQQLRKVNAKQSKDDLETNYIIGENEGLKQKIQSMNEKMIHKIEEQRNSQQLLVTLMISFVQIQALRSRLFQIEQSIRAKREKQINVFNQIKQLQYQQVEVEKILKIIKQLELSYHQFYQVNQRSRSSLIHKLNSDILEPPQNTTLYHQGKERYLTIDKQITELSLFSNQPSSLKKFDFQQSNKFYDSSLQYSINDDSSKLSSTNIQPSNLTTQFNNSIIETRSKQPSKVVISFNTNISNSQINKSSIFFPENKAEQRLIQPHSMINPNNNRYFNSNFVSISSRNIQENPSNILVQEVNRDETYSNKKVELQPYKFYQYSEGSIKSLKFPSESNLVSRNQKLPQNLFQISDISKQLIN